MAFYVGQKVVCVDDADHDTDPRTCPGSYWVPNWPKHGEIYTIRNIRGDGGVHLFEVLNPIRSWSDKPDGEVWWISTRFRPRIEKSTDAGMAILREILDRETVKDDKPIKVRSV